MHRKLIIVALLFLPLVVSSAFAMDPFTDAVQKAYAPYRSALFMTNTKSKAESKQAIQKAQEAWSSLTSQYGSKPPAPYDRDPGFSAALTEVDKIYVQAAREIDQDQFTQAHETLEKVRDVLAELRQRNQVIVFSDHMNAYHIAMEEVLLKGKQVLTEQQGMLKLTTQAGVLEYLGHRLVMEAPAQYKTNEEFLRLTKSIEKSIDDLKNALFAQDSKAVIEAMGHLKAPYSKLFLKFG
jgi:cystathionine beta-lyase/cystathionine gamma-synthase